ncbi:MAG: glycoside hydrolase family 31 protein [Bacteroidales bacterium]|nr:glycoside hydrolase family 31 protein [Bacteroidales bacterium]
MKKKVLIISLFAICCCGISSVIGQTGNLIGKNICAFYPAHYDAKPNLPSFALLKEPKTIGEVPKNWSLKPHFYSKNGKTIAALPIAKGTSLYGTGENTGSLIRNGKTITLWNTDNYKYQMDSGKRLYQSHPWVLGVDRDGTAFGVIADNSWKQQVELSDSIRFISDGPAFRVLVIQRNSPQEVIKELANLTGKMEMPPLWALGYQQSRYSYVPDTRIKEIADTLRMKSLPCDVIWMDINYMERFKIFTFDKINMPDPQAVNNYLHQKEFKSVWMIDPGVKVEKDYFVYESGSVGNHWVQNAEHKEFNGTVWPGKCAFPDFTRPETRSWWSALYKDFMATGIDGVWNDMNEPSVFDGPGVSMPENNWHRGGGDLQADVHLRYHNVYGMLMVKASRDGILKVNLDKRPFILSRSGFLGSSRYAATWTGDNCGTVEHMKMSVPLSLNLGLSGQPFSGPDMGGYALNTTSDLFGQWIAMGAFFPFMRGHAEKGTNNKEPWAFGTEIENVSRTALNRRYRLLPYFYTLFYEASKTGMPVMRPVFFADPKDVTLRNEEQTFLVGDNLLIIPKWAVNPSLPKGSWRTLSITGENSTIDKYQADVKVKGGAIIPMGKIIQNTTQYSLDSLTLIVSLDKNGKATGTLYEDAGDGFQYLKGEFLISGFTAKLGGSVVKVEITVKEGALKQGKRKYKVIVVTDNGSIESDWIQKNSISIKMP